jgi:four helix bundle protein
MDLTVRCYQVTDDFPRSELFRSTSQLRRAAYSIPFNISEGHCRCRSRAVFENHVDIARGSQGELENAIELAFRLDYLNEANANELFDRVAEVGRMLSGLADALAQGKDTNP